MNKLDKIIDYFSKIVMGVSVSILSVVTILQVIARFIFTNYCNRYTFDYIFHIFSLLWFYFY